MTTEVNKLPKRISVPLVISIVFISLGGIFSCIGTDVLLLTLFFLLLGIGGLFWVRKQLLSAQRLFNDVLAEKVKLEDYYQTNGYQELDANRAKIAQEKEDSDRQINEAIEKANVMLEEMENKVNTLQQSITKYSAEADVKELLLQKLTEDCQKREKAIETAKNKAKKAKISLDAMQHFLDNWANIEIVPDACKIPDDFTEAINELGPLAVVELKAMGIKDLRTAYNDLKRKMESLFLEYENRYTTKAFKSLYAFTVIYMRLELQAILLQLRFDKLDDANTKIHDMVCRVQQLCASGNQSILPTITKFIGQAEQLFLEAAKIEHMYYIRKEQQRQEQAEIRQRMKEEKEEAKRLAAEQKKIADEEAKYLQELERLKASLSEASEESAVEIQQQIDKVSANLNEVSLKKDEITKLQKGKAGTVYIISNLGSFGDDVFKVGMTRRFDPQERIDELGSASVPFEFDVHSFIFSEDAVALETALHNRLNSCRVNKINLRKEFFRLNIDDIEQLVQEIDPTAEFNKTMLAEEYRASLDGELIPELQDTIEDDEESLDEVEE